MGLLIFIVGAMLFFLTVETKLLISGGLSTVEKIISFICFGIIEIYYILQLLEHL